MKDSRGSVVDTININIYTKAIYILNVFIVEHCMYCASLYEYDWMYRWSLYYCNAAQPAVLKLAGHIQPN